MTKNNAICSLLLLAAFHFASSAAAAQNSAPAPDAKVPRVTPVPVDQMNAQQKRLIGIEPGKPLPGRAKSNLFRTFMHHPELIEKYLPLGDRVSRARELPDKIRELVIMRVAWFYQGEYEWAQHYGPALAAGWTTHDIERIKIGPNAAGWSPMDRTLLKATDQLLSKADLDDDTWAALREHYSVADLMALITMVGHYHWVAMISNAFEIDLDRELIQFESVATPLVNNGSVAFVEGPATRADGVVFFSDIPNNRIMRYDGKGPIKTHRSPSNRANGLIFDQHNALIIAETDGRIVREQRDGSIEVLTKAYNGARFNAPNDLALDTKGRIYFTDPAYRNRQKATQRDKNNKIIDGVYRIDNNGKVVRIITDEIDMPNGILVSPEDEFLYVAENNNTANGARKVWRFKLDSRGNISADSKTLIFDFGTERGPDGMTIDTEGNLYVTAGLNHAMPHRTNTKYKAGIYVISPAGDLLNFIAVPMDQVTNVTFGGADYKTLYITAGHSLWSYQVDIPGYLPFPRNPYGSGYSDLEGSVINYSYENFAGFRFAIGDGKIRWHGVEGYFLDITRDVNPQISKVADNIYFSSWPTMGNGGDNVVHNFNSMQVNGHLNPIDDNAGTLEMIHGVIHCKDTAECARPPKNLTSNEELFALMKKNAAEQNLPPLYDPILTRKARTKADQLARSELAGLAIRFNTPFGSTRIEVDGNVTRIAENNSSPESFQTYATKIADDLYFISWLGDKGGNHLVVNRQSMKAFDHIAPSGERAEMIYDVSCFGPANKC